MNRCDLCNQYIDWRWRTQCCVFDCTVRFCSEECARKGGAWTCKRCEDWHCAGHHPKTPHFQCHDCLFRFCSEGCAEHHRHGSDFCSGKALHDPTAVVVHVKTPLGPPLKTSEKQERKTDGKTTPSPGRPTNQNHCQAEEERDRAEEAEKSDERLQTLASKQSRKRRKRRTKRSKKGNKKVKGSSRVKHQGID